MKIKDLIENECYLCEDYYSGSWSKYNSKYITQYVVINNKKCFKIVKNITGMPQQLNKYYFISSVNIHLHRELTPLEKIKYL